MVEWDKLLQYKRSCMPACKKSQYLQCLDKFPSEKKTTIQESIKYKGITAKKDNDR